MNLAFTLAVGDKKWGNMALNWCLSVKNATPKAKTLLIFQPSAISGIEEYIHHFFDYTLQVQDSETSNPNEYAFELKTKLYDLATSAVEADAYLYMDADTIMLSGRSVDEFFAELKDVEFTMWCNDVYDFETKTRMRDDYTFWCEPEEVFESLNTIDRGTGKMPQVNSSFIYFRKSKSLNELFSAVKAAYKIDLPYKPYKGSKPDELCFNIACASLDILPHQIPYYPIFFSFASENFEEQYIRNWKAIGFAGDQMQQEGVIHLYRHNVEYFRKEANVEEPFDFMVTANKKPKDRHPLAIEPVSKRTIFRRDEVENSGGGIFNPDGFYKDGCYVTIFRKETNHDFYKAGHNQATAIPHVEVISKDKNEHFELEYSGLPGNVRVEDFRIVGEARGDADYFLVSHSVIKNNLTPKMTIEVGFSFVNLTTKKFNFCCSIKPFEGTGNIEKNWVFFYDDKDILHCIYSLSPYRIFALIEGGDASDKNSWQELSVFQPEFDWFHKSQMICNSTRPVKIGNEYLMLFHTKEAGVFFQGAVVIDAHTKEITHYTKRSIPLRSYAEGFQAGLIYASGLCYLPERNILRVFFGESDSHSCYNDYKADEFIELVKQNPVESTQTTLNEIKEIL